MSSILIRRFSGPIDRLDGLTTKQCVCLPFNSPRERLVIELTLSSAIAKMEIDWWIELENTYKTRLAQRKDLYATHGKRVLDYLPGSELAYKELMEMVLQYACARYPRYFSLLDKRIFQTEF